MRAALATEIAGCCLFAIVAALLSLGRETRELPPVQAPPPDQAGSSEPPPFAALPISMPPAWPTCPSVWSVVQNPKAYAGVDITLDGYAIIGFEHAQLLQTREEAEIKYWRWHFQIVDDERQELPLRWDVHPELDRHKVQGAAVRVTGRVEPGHRHGDPERQWDWGGVFQVSAILYKLTGATRATEVPPAGKRGDAVELHRTLAGVTPVEAGKREE